MDSLQNPFSRLRNQDSVLRVLATTDSTASHYFCCRLPDCYSFLPSIGGYLLSKQILFRSLKKVEKTAKREEDVPESRRSLIGSSSSCFFSGKSQIGTRSSERPVVVVGAFCTFVHLLCIFNPTSTGASGILLFMLQRALRSLDACRCFTSARPNAFRGDETRVVRSPYADIPPIPNSSITELILKRSKLFRGLFSCREFQFCFVLNVLKVPLTSRHFSRL